MVRVGREELGKEKGLVREGDNFYMERGEEEENKAAIEGQIEEEEKEEEAENQGEEKEEGREEERREANEDEQQDRGRGRRKGECGSKSISNRQPKEKKIEENQRWVKEQFEGRENLRSGGTYLKGREEELIERIMKMGGGIESEQVLINVGNERMTEGENRRKEKILKLKIKEEGVPTSYKEIESMEDEMLKNKWIQAVDREMYGLFKNETLKFVKKEDMEKGIEVIGSGLVLEKKANGELKARFVAKETIRNTRYKYGKDELYAPVVAIHSLKMIFALLADDEKLRLRHLDISQAYTSTAVEEGVIIYVKLAVFGKRYHGEIEGVYQLGNWLYGIRPSAAKFNELMDRKIRQFGYVRNGIEPCLYSVEKKKKNLDLASLYVDDVIKLGTEESNDKLEQGIAKRFLYTNQTDEGKILNITWTHDPVKGVVELHQPDYIKAMAKEFNITKTRNIPKPFKREDQLSEEEQVLVDPREFMQMVGVLMYVKGTTRADLMLTVAFLCSKMKEPNEHDKQIAIGAMEYLLGTIYKKLTFRRQVDPEMRNRLIGFGDGGGLATTVTAKARIAYTILLNGGDIRSKSGITDFVENNMMNVEFVASYYAWLELRAIADMMEGFCKQKVVLLYSDNESSIFVAYKPFQTRKSRLIRLVYWALREACEDGSLELKWCPTERMIADVGTKSMGGKIFEKLVDLILGRTIWSLEGKIQTL